MIAQPVGLEAHFPFILAVELGQQDRRGVAFDEEQVPAPGQLGPGQIHELAIQQLGSAGFHGQHIHHGTARLDH